jgi:hypothetical protein
MRAIDRIKQTADQHIRDHNLSDSVSVDFGEDDNILAIVDISGFSSTTVILTDLARHWSARDNIRGKNLLIPNNLDASDVWHLILLNFDWYSL